VKRETLTPEEGIKVIRDAGGIPVLAHPIYLGLTLEELDAYATGKGKIIVRAVATIEQMPGNKQRIVVTELPYQVNKAKLIERIAELVKEKRIDSISDLRDESDKDGMRIVIELKKDANANVVLNQLYKNTQMQDAFNVNMVALVLNNEKKFEPRVLNLRQAIDYYIKHQEDVIVRRTKFDLDKAEARAHILEGLRIAIDNLDEVINIIRSSRNESDAKEALIQRFGFSEKQAQAIVDMRLGRLTALEREKIDNEYKELLKEIKYYKDVLANKSMVLDIIKKELEEIKQKYGDERRTKIIPDEDEIEIEDLIEVEENVVTLTHFGYIKRLPTSTYKSQKRGGKGVIGLSTREEDFVEQLFITSTHDYILFFTNKGKVYRLKTYEIPEAGRQAKGTAIVNLLQLDQNEKITTVIPIREDLNHTGSHKINNVLGQVLLAKRMGKKRVIAETGAGQHGVATATAAALMGLECEIFMGKEDTERQALNVFRMELLGAKVHAVTSGTQTLKDAVNETLREWSRRVHDTHYVLGSVMGPHPFPTIVRDFQSVIGREIKKQIMEKEGKLPDVVMACVGGGSNAIGAFYEFIGDSSVRLIGCEAAGKGLDTDKHAATMSKGTLGIFHGMKSYFCQDEYGQIAPVYSISAGLDYPGVGPEHAYLKDIGRAQYVAVTDDEAVEAFEYLSRTEGIIPAIESSHAVAYAMKLAPTMSKDQIIVICLSGRGDKDVAAIARYRGVQIYE